MAHRGCSATGGKKGKHRRRLKPWQPPRVIRTEYVEEDEEAEMEKIRKNARLPAEYVPFLSIATGSGDLADVTEALGERRNWRKKKPEE